MCAAFSDGLRGRECADKGILRTSRYGDLRWDESAYPAAVSDVLRVHEWSYVLAIKQVLCTAAVLRVLQVALRMGHCLHGQWSCWGLEVQLQAVGASLQGSRCCTVRRLDQLWRGWSRAVISTQQA